MTPLGPLNWPPHIGATKKKKYLVNNSLNAQFLIYKLQKV